MHQFFFRNLDAFFDEYPFLQLRRKRCVACELDIHKTSISKSYWGIAVSKNSSLKESLSAAIFELHRQGVLYDLYKKWFSDEHVKTKIDPTITKYTLKSLGNIFLYLAVFVVVSCFLLAFENICWYFCKKTKKTYTIGNNTLEDL